MTSQVRGHDQVSARWLFADGVRIYETNNNGRWYDFGFMLGIGAYASNHEVRQGVLGTPR